jgi:hypothetical protein
MRTLCARCSVDEWVAMDVQLDVVLSLDSTHMNASLLACAALEKKKKW